MAAVLTASERRKRLKLKRIVVTEHNYLALKKVVAVAVIMASILGAVTLYVRKEHREYHSP